LRRCGLRGLDFAEPTSPVDRVLLLFHRQDRRLVVVVAFHVSIFRTSSRRTVLAESLLEILVDDHRIGLGCRTKAGPAAILQANAVLRPSAVAQQLDETGPSHKEPSFDRSPNYLPPESLFFSVPSHPQQETKRAGRDVFVSALHRQTHRLLAT